MSLTTRRPITNSYSVEASGWDRDRTFFVEKSELEWNEETGKFLALTRSLCPGATIFLRLLQATSLDRSVPVACRAEPVGETPEGHQQFRLGPIQPNGGSKDEVK
jgi:hypothetical protein